MNSVRVGCLLGTLLLSACLATYYSALADLLILDRSAVFEGQLWRIVSGHLVHLSDAHLLWDCSVFSVLTFLLHCLDRRLVAGVLTSSALVIGLAVVLFIPQVSHYGGLSGICCALFMAIVTVLRLQVQGPMKWVVNIATLAFVAKIIAELFSQTTLFVDPDPTWISLPQVHIAGGLAGTAWAYLFLTKDRLRSKLSLNFGRRGQFN